MKLKDKILQIIREEVGDLTDRPDVKHIPAHIPHAHRVYDVHMDNAQLAGVVIRGTCERCKQKLRFRIRSEDWDVMDAFP